MSNQKLTDKQAIFVKEYLVDLNATQAAIRAGYSAKTANEQGSRLLTNVSVQKLIQEHMNKRSERTEITAEYVLTGIKRVTESAEADGRRSEALKGFELMAKHLMLFTDKTEITGANGKDIVSSGVLLVPSTMSVDEWEKSHCKK